MFCLVEVLLSELKATTSLNDLFDTLTDFLPQLKIVTIVYVLKLFWLGVSSGPRLIAVVTNT